MSTKSPIHKAIVCSLALSAMTLAVNDAAAKKAASVETAPAAAQPVSAPAAPAAATSASTAIAATPSGTIAPTPTVKPAIAAALRIDTVAQQAIVLDYHTGQVVFEKNADQPMHPSSMTKIMTAYMAFDHLKKGLVTLDTTFPVSVKAWKAEGSRMFIKVDSQVSVDDLINGIIVQSGNDACTAFAEGASGTEEVFAALMTEVAQSFGCQHTQFRNASGLPHPEHLTTARDLAIIARRVVQDFPEYYAYFSKPEFTYNKITQQNRNPLLNKNIGCDGLKTGFTDQGQYGLVASAKEIDPQGNPKRFIVVINGCPKQNIRAQEAQRLMTWAMKTFATIPIAKGGQVLATVDISAGTQRTVPLTIAKDAFATLPQLAVPEIKTELVYDRTIQAPIKAGQAIGKAIITAPTFPAPIEVDLVATQDVERAGIFKRFWNTVSHIFAGDAA